MTAIQLLEKIGAEPSFDLNLLSKEDKENLEKIIDKAQTFNAVQSISPPDEEEEQREEKEEEKVS